MNNTDQTKKTSFNPFPEMENEVLDFWDKADIFKKSIRKEAPQGDYVFYDGPPFATGEPHYGHLVGSIMKDAVPRYWTMNGYRVERKWGWDCHGLPIENIAEKELGIMHKKEIEEMGVDKFNEFCRSKVLGYVDIWKKIIRRMGRWADMENPYQTMDLNYMESIWWVFKELWDKGLIYESYRSMHICPRCETTLSQSEVAEGYKNIKDLSVTAKFELVDEPGTFVLAWTTTPWTLIGNVALAVGKDINYVKVKPDQKWYLEKDLKNIVSDKNELYIIAKELLDEIFVGPYDVVAEFKGSDLIGKKYKPLFDYYSKDEKLENRQNGWKIYAGDFVTTEDGTGVVHIAPAFGEDDMNLGKANNLPFVQHVGMDGLIKPEATEFAGLHVKPIENVQETDVKILKYLVDHNTFFDKQPYLHSYPHCWRCETPLINYATSSYFVKVTEIKDKMLEYAKNINWSPDYIKEGRFGNWLEGARDWSISRQRYWASVMPVWKCECGETKVIGSVKELEDLSGQKVTDLHKHIVDKITFPCAKCSQTMKRIPDVLDTWFDSGSMPYAQEHYPFENKERFEKNFPAQFIAEGIDQTRCWFYYLHVIATGIRNSNAFQNVIANGIVLAEDGKKMSKRLKNYPDPSFIFDNYSADAMRFYSLSSPVMLAENLNFSESGVKDVLRGISITLWNVYKFYEMFEDKSKVDLPAGEAGSQKLKVDGGNILDQWIVAKLNELIKEVTDNMNAYNLPKATRPIMDFINDFSTWYLRRSRDRFKGDDLNDKEQALATTKFVLTELAKVMAPFTPFIAEQIWQKVTGNNFADENKSVHLESWPNAGLVNTELLTAMTFVKSLATMALNLRDQHNIKVRQPLPTSSVNKTLFVKHMGGEIPYWNEVKDILADEINVKNVELDATMTQDDPVIKLDTTITDELKLEGAKRDIVRQINMLRKNAGLTINDKIILHWQSDGQEIKDVFAKFTDELKKETLSSEILEKTVGENATSVKINNQEIKLEIEK